MNRTLVALDPSTAGDERRTLSSIEAQALRAARTRDRVSARHLVLLAALAVLPYVNALRTGFTLDDEPDIRTNAAVTHGIDPIGALSTPMYPGDLFRPLTVISYAANETLTPGAPLPFHAVNICLHAIVTLLVFAFGLQLFGISRSALIAAALFAVHPIHTEAVTSLVGRAELLAALFGLLALLTAGDDRPRPPWSAGLRRATSITCFSLAVLSKESGLVLLPLIVLLRSARRGERFWPSLWQELRTLDWLPYGLCAALFLVLRFYVIYAVTPPDTLTPLDNVFAFVPLTVRIRSALGVLWDYFGLLHVPIVLAADYSLAQVPIIRSWSDPRFVGGALLVVAAALALTQARSRRLGFVVAFPFVALALTANVLFPVGTVKAERLLYLPSVGWALLIAYGCEAMLRLPRYRRLTGAALVIVIAAFVARTWTRNWDWTDNLTLYASMVRSAPDSAKARYNFGITLQHHGDDAGAVAQFERALAIYPYAEGAALGIGIAYETKGRIDEAIQWYERALTIMPGFAKAHTNLCHVLSENGRFTAAATACRRGLRYTPTDANLLKGLGASLVNLGATDRGIAVLQRSLALNAQDEELRAFVARLTAPGTSADR